MRYFKKQPISALAALLLAAATGCIKLDSFTCAQSSECQNGDLLGTCEVGGLCSFPDPLCPSGKKFGEFAGDQSGQCVGEPGTTDSDATTTTSPTGSAGPTTLEPTSTTLEITGTTPELTSTSGSSTDPTTSTDDPTLNPGTITGGECGEVGESCLGRPCCGECMACNAENVCVAQTLQDKVDLCGGACFACGPDGYCGPAPIGASCPFNCAQIIDKQVVNGPLAVCYGFGAMATTGTCDGIGSCTPPNPIKADCPHSFEKLVECDATCLQENGACISGNLINTVNLDNYCVLNSTTPACQASCSPNNMALIFNSCNGLGQCATSDKKSCNGYYCDSMTLTCPESCMTGEQCVSTVCDLGVCL